jgi:hypothetical protein
MQILKHIIHLLKDMKSVIDVLTYQDNENWSQIYILISPIRTTPRPS